MNQDVEKLLAIIADKDKALADKDKALADKDKALADKDKALAEKDNIIALAVEEVRVAKQEAEEKVRIAEENTEEKVRVAVQEALLARIEEEMRNTHLINFLEGCHDVRYKINLPDSPNSATKGAVTDPTNRRYPLLIKPWIGFSYSQRITWKKLFGLPFSKSNLFWSSHHLLSKFLPRLRGVRAEVELRFSVHLAVEIPVTDIFSEAYKNDEVCESLELVQGGEVEFLSHTNLRNSTNSNRLTNSTSSNRLTNSSSSNKITKSSAGVRLAPKPRESFCVGQADQFCMYRHADGSERAVLAIEYKPPHKLRVEHVTAGLKGEIQPKREVINKKDSKHPQWIVAAVITQLFSYMVAKRLRYGYVCTGLVYIFLRIDATDPRVVEYYVSEPSEDAKDGKLDSLHLTAVGQVFAFTLQAIAAEAPTSDWLDRIESLELWNVGSDGGRSGEDGGSSSTSGSALPPPQKTPKEHNENHSTSGKKHAEQINCANHTDTTVGIRDRPFCTQRCLLGLARGGALDANCPNAAAHAAHGPHHIASEHFLELLGEQLNIDHGADTECCVPMWWRGYIGGLFRVRLHSHGYTLVAKAVETVNRSFLVDELHIYDRLVPIQGQYVPVCLGMLDTVRPHCAEGGVFHHFLLLSWGGRPLSEVGDGIDGVTAAVDAAFRAIHELGVRHGDAELRNVLFDKDTGKVLVIDFERSTYFPPQEPAKQNPPSQLDMNSGLAKQKPLSQLDMNSGLAKQKPPPFQLSQLDMNSGLEHNRVVGTFEKNMAATAVQNPNQFQDELQHITTRARQRKLR